MARMLIRGSSQIMSGTIFDAQISATAAIATSKLAEGSLFFKKDGSIAMTGDLDAGNNKLVNVANGAAASDAVNKGQLDAAIAGVSTPSFTIGQVPTGLIDGANTTYTLTNAPTAGSLALYLNGQRLQAGAGNDYTLAGSTITTLFAPATGDQLMADYRY